MKLVVLIFSALLIIGIAFIRFGAGDTDESSVTRVHHIDPYRQFRSSNKLDFLEECKNRAFSVYAELEACTQDALARFNKEYPDRGTVEFCDKKYGKLALDELVTELNQLVNLSTRVSYSFSKENSHSELDTPLVEFEIAYIKNRILAVKENNRRTSLLLEAYKYDRYQERHITQ